MENTEPETEAASSPESQDQTADLDSLTDAELTALTRTILYPPSLEEQEDARQVQQEAETQQLEGEIPEPEESPPAKAEDDDDEDLIPIVPYKDKQIRHLHTFTNQDRKNIKRTGHKVQGKHIETGEIKVWNSAAEAAAEVAGTPRKNSNILSCARNCYRCYGYKWSIVEEHHKKKPVFGIHKKTERLGPRYESITEAMNALRGTSAGSALIKSLKHPGRYSYRGFYWYYG